jgi:hypothetical protein
LLDFGLEFGGGVALQDPDQFGEDHRVLSNVGVEDADEVSYGIEED